MPASVSAAVVRSSWAPIYRMGRMAARRPRIAHGTVRRARSVPVGRIREFALAPAAISARGDITPRIRGRRLITPFSTRPCPFVSLMTTVPGVSVMQGNGGLSLLNHAA